MGIIFRFLGFQFDEQHLVHLLPELRMPQLLEDVVNEDCNECSKCYDDRGVPNCKLISFREFDIVSAASMIKFRVNKLSSASRHELL